MESAKNETVAQDVKSVLPPTDTESDTMKAGIDEALEQEFPKASKPAEKAKADEPAKTETKTEQPAKEPVKTDDKADADKVDDAAFERAVKAGIPIEQAKAFTSKAQLEKMSELLEKKPAQETTQTEEKATKPATETQTADDEYKLPDFPKEEEWDPKLTEYAKKCNEVISKLNGRIAKLEAQKAGAAAPDKFASLPEAYRPLVGESGKALSQEQQEARTKIGNVFEVLKAGYKSQGVAKPDDEVFKDALKFALGDVEADAKRTKSVGERVSLAVARPGNGGAGTRKSSGEADPEKDIAAELHKEFGI